jgi:hypothetical protein
MIGDTTTIAQINSIYTDLVLFGQDVTVTVNQQASRFPLLLACAVTTLLIGIWILWRTTGLTRFQQYALSTLRIAIFVILLLMMMGWTQQEHTTQNPDLLILIDRSESMQLEDQYSMAELGRFISGSTVQSEWSLPRWELLTAWLDNMHLDSANHRWHEGESELNKPLARLSEDYRISVYHLGSNLRLAGRGVRENGDLSEAQDFDQPESRIGDAIRQAVTQHRGRSIAAVIVLTDGINTNGSSLQDASDWIAKKSIPLLIGGFGSLQQTPDIALENPLAPTMAHVGEQLFLEVDLNLLGELATAGKPLQVQVLASLGNNSDPFVQIIEAVSNDAPSKRLRIPFVPSQVGRAQIRVAISAISEESNTDNNSVEFEINVTDDATRILLIENMPRFEYRALLDLFGRSIDSEPTVNRFSVDSVLFSADARLVEMDKRVLASLPTEREQLFQYDVIVVGDVESRMLSVQFQQLLIEFVEQRGGGIVFVAGPIGMPTTFAGQPLEKLFPVAADQFQEADDLDQTNEIILNSLGERFSHLQLGTEVTDNVSAWQSLTVPYWSVTSDLQRPGVHILSTLGAVNDEVGPLITQQFIGAGKVVFHWFDATWRWNESVEASAADVKPFDQYWEQTMRYMSRQTATTDGTGLIEIVVAGEAFVVGESVPVTVRFLDERTAPSDDHAVMVVVEHSNGRRQFLRLARLGADRGRFAAPMQGLERGTYRVHLVEPVVFQNGEKNAAVASFTVIAPQGELVRQTLSDIEKRQIIAPEHGRYFNVSELHELVANVPRGTPVRVGSKVAKPLWNANWIVAILISLLAIDWTLRRRWYN